MARKKRVDDAMDAYFEREKEKARQRRLTAKDWKYRGGDLGEFGRPDISSEYVADHDESE